MRSLFGVMTLLTLCAALPAWSQTAAAPEMPGHVRLRLLPAPAKDLVALPRIVPNQAVTAPTAARINARFDRLDRDAKSMSTTCIKAQRKQSGMDGDFTRDVTVTMRGPRYLSLDVEDAFDCGGPHPNSSSEGLVYDVTTGEHVAWPALLPGTRAGYASRDGSGNAQVIWPELQRRALAMAPSDTDSDCKRVYRDDGLQFTLWLDGDTGTLEASPTGLTHIDTAFCSVQVSLDVPTLRKLGAAKTLTDALEAASKEQTPEAVKRRAAAAHRNK